MQASCSGRRTLRAHEGAGAARWPRFETHLRRNGASRRSTRTRSARSPPGWRRRSPGTRRPRLPCPRGPTQSGIWPCPSMRVACWSTACHTTAAGYVTQVHWETITADTDLSATLSTAEFARLVRSTLTEAWIPAAGVAAHSMRVGAATTLMHGGLPMPTLSPVLRHRDQRSSEALQFPPLGPPITASSTRLGSGTACARPACPPAPSQGHSASS